MILSGSESWEFEKCGGDCLRIFERIFPVKQMAQ
jgi:hypothetical protein